VAVGIKREDKKTQWLTAVIPATQKAKIGRITV
jgi:hypothetical protein